MAILLSYPFKVRFNALENLRSLALAEFGFKEAIKLLRTLLIIAPILAVTRGYAVKRGSAWAGWIRQWYDMLDRQSMKETGRTPAVGAPAKVSYGMFPLDSGERIGQRPFAGKAALQNSPRAGWVAISPSLGFTSCQLASAPYIVPIPLSTPIKMLLVVGAIILLVSLLMGIVAFEARDTNLFPIVVCPSLLYRPTLLWILFRPLYRFSISALFTSRGERTISFVLIKILRCCRKLVLASDTAFVPIPRRLLVSKPFLFGSTLYAGACPAAFISFLFIKLIFWLDLFTGATPLMAFWCGWGWFSIFSPASFGLAFLTARFKAIGSCPVSIEMLRSCGKLFFAARTALEDSRHVCPSIGQIHTRNGRGGMEYTPCHRVIRPVKPYSILSL